MTNSEWKLPKNTALFVIDVQQGHDDPRFGRRNNPDAEARIATLLDAWRTKGLPVIHVQHLSIRPASAFHPSHPGVAIKPIVAPRADETLVQKSANSAFIGTNLEQMLRERGIGTVILTGLTTPHCVSSTARMAGNLGFATFVVADATAANEGTVDLNFPGGSGIQSDPELVHMVSLATINGEFVTVVDTAQVMAAVQQAEQSV
jgi:nicotinamidase-related amidase